MILETFLLFTEIPTEKMLQRQISSPTFFLENIFDDTLTHLGHLTTSPCQPLNQVVAAVCNKVRRGTWDKPRPHAGQGQAGATGPNGDL